MTNLSLDTGLVAIKARYLNDKVLDCLVKSFNLMLSCDVKIDMLRSEPFYVPMFGIMCNYRFNREQTRFLLREIIVVLTNEQQRRKRLSETRH